MSRDFSQRPASQSSVRPCSQRAAQGSGLVSQSLPVPESRPATQDSLRSLAQTLPIPRSPRPGLRGRPEIDEVAKERVQAVFQRFDLNGDGKISQDELMQVLRQLDPSKKKWQDRRIAQLLGYLDVDNDLNISLGEFTNFLYTDRYRRERRDLINTLGAQFS